MDKENKTSEKKLTLEKFKEQTNIYDVIRDEIEEKRKLCLTKVDKLGKQLMNDYFKGKQIGKSIVLNVPHLPNPCTYDIFKASSNLIEVVTSTIDQQIDCDIRNIEDTLKKYYDLYLVYDNSELLKKFPSLKFNMQKKMLDGDKNSKKRSNTKKLTLEEFKTHTNIYHALKMDFEMDRKDLLEFANQTGEQKMKDYLNGKPVFKSFVLKCAKLPDPCTYEIFKASSNIQEIMETQIDKEIRKRYDEIEKYVQISYDMYLTESQDELLSSLPYLKFHSLDAKKKKKSGAHSELNTSTVPAASSDRSSNPDTINGHNLPSTVALHNSRKNKTNSKKNYFKTQCKKLTLEEFKEQTNIYDLLKMDVEMDRKDMLELANRTGEQKMKDYLNGKPVYKSFVLKCPKLPDPCTYEIFKASSNIQEIMENQIDKEIKRRYDDIEKYVIDWYDVYLTKGHDKLLKYFPQLQFNYVKANETPNQQTVELDVPTVAEPTPGLVSHQKQAAKLSLDDFKLKSNAFELAHTKIESKRKEMEKAARRIGEKFMKKYLKGELLDHRFIMFCKQLPDPCSYAIFEKCSNVEEFVKIHINDEIAKLTDDLENEVKRYYELYLADKLYELPMLAIEPETPMRPLPVNRSRLIQTTLPFTKRKEAQESNQDVLNQVREMTLDQFREKTNVISLVCIEIGKKTEKHFASLPSKVKLIYEMFVECKETGKPYTVIKNLTFNRLWEDRVPSFEEFQATSNVRKIAHKLISYEVKKERRGRDQMIRHIYGAARNGTSHHLLSKIELKEYIPIGGEDGFDRDLILNNENMDQTVLDNFVSTHPGNEDMVSDDSEINSQDTQTNTQDNPMPPLIQRLESQTDQILTDMINIHESELNRNDLEPIRETSSTPSLANFSTDNQTTALNGSILAQIDSPEKEHQQVQNSNLATHTGSHSIGDISLNQSIKNQLEKVNAEFDFTPSGIAMIHNEPDSILSQESCLLETLENSPEPMNPPSNSHEHYYANKILQQQFHALKLKLNSFDELLKVNMQGEIPAQIEHINSDYSFKVPSNIVKMQVDIKIRPINDGAEDPVQRTSTSSCETEAFQQFLYNTNIISLTMEAIQKRFPNEPHRFLSLQKYIYRFYKKNIEGKSVLPPEIVVNNAPLTELDQGDENPDDEHPNPGQLATVDPEPVTAPLRSEEPQQVSQDLFSNSTPENSDTIFSVAQDEQFADVNEEIEPMRPLRMSDEEDEAEALVKNESFSDYGDDVQFISPEKSHVLTLEDSATEMDWLEISLQPNPAFAPEEAEFRMDALESPMELAEPIGSDPLDCESPQSLKDQEINITVVEVQADKSPKSNPYSIEPLNDSMESTSLPLPAKACHLGNKKQKTPVKRKILESVVKHGVCKRPAAFSIEDGSQSQDSIAHLLEADNSIFSVTKLPMPVDISMANKSPVRSLQEIQKVPENDAGPSSSMARTDCSKVTMRRHIPITPSARVSHLANKLLTEVKFTGSALSGGQSEKSMSVSLIQVKKICNRLQVEGNSIRHILELNNGQWQSLKQLLGCVDNFEFSLRKPEPKNRSIIHRIFYQLLRTAPKFGSAVFEMVGDGGISAHCFHYDPSNFCYGDDSTDAINPLILRRMAESKLLN